MTKSPTPETHRCPVPDRATRRMRRDPREPKNTARDQRVWQCADCGAWWSAPAGPVSSFDDRRFVRLEPEFDGVELSQFAAAATRAAERREREAARPEAQIARAENLLSAAEQALEAFERKAEQTLAKIAAERSKRTRQVEVNRRHLDEIRARFLNAGDHPPHA